jgi:hypothetical protein
MFADTFITAGRPLVCVVEKRRALVTKHYVPHDFLNKKEVHTAEFLEEEESYDILVTHKYVIQ